MVRLVPSFVFFALIAILGLTDCTSGNRLELTDGDSAALNRLYQSGDWTFQKSSFDISVLENHAIRIAIKGKATRKASVSNGALMIPVALMADLPEYYEILGDKKDSIELQCYKVAGGLWNIVAVFSPAPEVEELLPVDISVLLISPKIKNQVPVLIPSGQSQNTVDASISLPAYEKFDSLSLSPTEDTPVSLTPLPASIADGANRAAAKLPSNKSAAWDFSQVTYSSSTGTPWLKFVLAGSLVPLLLLAGMSAYRFIFTRWWRRQERSVLNLKYRRGDEVSALVSVINTYGHQIAGAETIEEVVSRIRCARHPFVTHAEEELIEKLETTTDKTSFHLASLRPTQKMVEALERFEFHLERVVNINSQLLDLTRSEPTTAQLRLAPIFICLIALLFLLLFFQDAIGQEPLPQPTSPAPVRIAALGEFGIVVKPIEGETNKVDIRLSFIPLANSKIKEEKGIVGMGTGDNTGEISDFRPQPEKMVETIQISKKSVSVKTPITPLSSSVLDVLSADPAIRISEVDIQGSYRDSVDHGNVVRFDYALTGTFNHEYKTENSWIHWFPFDTKSIEIPFRLVQPAILEQIEFIKPPDFTGEISAQGFDAEFSDKGKTFNLHFKDDASRNTIYPEQDVKLTARFTRPLTQKIWLTGGQIFFALIGGTLLGWIASKPKRIGYTGLIEGFGVLALGFVIRNSVFSAYPGLPSILAGQTPVTILDIFFLISLIVLLIASGYSCLVGLEKKIDRRRS